MRPGIPVHLLLGAVLAASGVFAGCAQPALPPINTCSEISAAPSGQAGKLQGVVLSPENTEARVRAGFVEKNDGDLVLLDVPEGTESVALMAQGSGRAIVAASAIQTPSGKVVWDFLNDVSINKTSPDDDPYTLLLPSNNVVAMEPGTWAVRLLTDHPRGKKVKVKAFFKPKLERDHGKLNLNLYFVGLDGLDGESARTDKRFQTLLNRVEAIFQGAGVSFGDIQYIDVTGENAQRYRVTNSFDKELPSLFKLSKGRTEKALNFFFVADLVGESSGFSLLGQSGGVPGPPVHGTGKSGVVINMSDFQTNPRSIEVVMAHEAGHYLGLFHTTERNGRALDLEGITGFDPLCGTPLCPDEADTNGNGILSAKECASRDGRNLMFSLANRRSRKLTPAQGSILRRHVLIQ